MNRPSLLHHLFTVSWLLLGRTTRIRGFRNEQRLVHREDLMMPDVVAQRSSSSAIDCPPSHASEHKTHTHQLSISLLSHSHTPATRSSPSASSAMLSSTKPYRCPCNLVTSTASRSFNLSSAFLENAKEHDRMMPSFDRMSAVWGNHELGVRSTLKKASTYHRSPRESVFDLVRELWRLAKCPVPGLP